MSGTSETLTKLGAGPPQSDPQNPQASEPLVETPLDEQPVVRAFRGVCQGGSPTWRNAPFGVPAMAKKPPTQTVRRSSETGQFVTKKEADRHPRTTETQRIKKPSK